MAKKKKPLPPRCLRMNRGARLSSARHWLATQKKRTPVQIAKSYRKRYGVDWPCAIRELALLGVSIDPGWVEQLNRSLEGHHQERARRKAARNLNPNSFGGDSDSSFAYIAGYTENGIPFGVTWDEIDGKR
jgi:hypothetical protein